ncbi:MAG: hypothetical protein LBV48_01025 [Mycoplasmataceae bacterium]|jgi:hypothetical protein|nr:hypothetical protein [Mycoplasmataceae bacterium]
MFNTWQSILMLVFALLDQGLMIPFVFMRAFNIIKHKKSDAIKWNLELVQVLGRACILVWCVGLLQADIHNLYMTVIYMLSCACCIISSLTLAIYKLRKTNINI